MAKKNFSKLAKGDLKTKKSLFDEVQTGFDYRALGLKHLPDARLVPIEKIKPDPNQPRKIIDEESIDSLADSIRQYGIIQTLNVWYSEEEDIFYIINGERRYRAAKKAGKEYLPCRLKIDAPDDFFERQIIENMQREDLNVLDEALGIKELIDNHNKTQAETAKIIGKSQAYISNVTKILDLPQKVLDEIPGARPPKVFLFKLRNRSIKPIFPK